MIGGTAWQMAGPQDVPVVVLVHGLGLTRAIWADHVPALAAQYRVLSYDLHGHGDSAPPAGAPSLARLSAQLGDLLDGLGIARAAVVGFSLGGMINRRFAMDQPGRVWALGILNAPHERSAEAQTEAEARAVAGGPEVTIDATLARWFTPGFRAAHPARVAAIRAAVLVNDPALFMAHRLVLAQGVRELIRPDPPITAPSLVLTCAGDTGSTPAMARAIAAEIAGATLCIVPDLQHMGLVERPELFHAPVLAHLNRVRDQGGLG